MSTAFTDINAIALSLGLEAPSPMTTISPLPTPVAHVLSGLVRHENSDPDELLKHRFLCRGGGMLLVGPTGIGKSSFSMQAMLLWALGREAFGIKPVRPLRSLLIQAENDDGDIAEMRDGVVRGLKLQPQEFDIAAGNIQVCREDSRTSVAFFEHTVRSLLAEHKPDLLWIDPALAYLGGESVSQKDVGAFLRNGLNPLLHEFRCGGIVVHHTNKPSNGQEKGAWSGNDFAYLGNGSIEWANWARAVLAIRGVGSHSVFQLIAGKRGSRLGWKKADESTTSYSKFIAHAKESGVICWREADFDEVPKGDKKKQHTMKDVLALVPVDGKISKSTLINRAVAAGIGQNKARGFISELGENKELQAINVARPGNRPEVHLARTSAMSTNQASGETPEQSGSSRSSSRAETPVNNDHEIHPHEVFTRPPLYRGHEDLREDRKSQNDRSSGCFSTNDRASGIPPCPIRMVNDMSVISVPMKPVNVIPSFVRTTTPQAPQSALQIVSNASYSPGTTTTL